VKAFLIQGLRRGEAAHEYRHGRRLIKSLQDIARTLAVATWECDSLA
jgi:hypothetical protein